MTPDILTQSFLLTILSYNKNTGVFIWINTRCTTINNGDIAGSEQIFHNKKKYRVIGIGSKVYLAHRLVWMYVHGDFPKDQIDHINGDGLDNRLINLRDVTCIENRKNARKNTNNKSGVTGVVWYKAYKKWNAQICVDRKHVFLGYHDDFNDAVIARKMAEYKYGFHVNHGRAT